MIELKRLKVATIVGTRPELIRLSRVMALLEEYVDHILIHTGQNYDYELNEIFFRDLGIREPDHYLRVDVSSLGRVLGDTISKSEEVLRNVNPDAVLILGDTNSSLAGIMAKRLKIPVYHMEAGNRCFDLDGLTTGIHGRNQVVIALLHELTSQLARPCELGLIRVELLVHQHEPAHPGRLWCARARQPR